MLRHGAHVHRSCFGEKDLPKHSLSLHYASGGFVPRSITTSLCRWGTTGSVAVWDVDRGGNDYTTGYRPTRKARHGRHPRHLPNS